MVRHQDSLPVIPRFLQNQVTPEGSSNLGQILCCYINWTSQIQIVRSTNLPTWYFERVVFPGERILFEALPSEQIEIHTGMVVTAILSDKIPCMRLRVLTESTE